MNDNVKKIITAIVVVGVLAGAGYGVFKLYHWVIKDATSRIRKGVSQGIGGGIGKIINPISWFR